MASVKSISDGKKKGFLKLKPEALVSSLASVGYECPNYLAVQVALIMNSPRKSIRTLLLEGPSGCGKSYLAKSLAKISGAEFMTLPCYEDMKTEHLLEYPSTLGMVNAMVGKGENTREDLLTLGPISRAFLASQTRPVIVLIDELDKAPSKVDTFFLGPIQDAKVWLESREPIEANIENLLLVFTKNFCRVIDGALLRRVHPLKMTYLDAEQEARVLADECHPQIAANLVALAQRIRDSGGSYEFERAPAPEELLTCAHYISGLLRWGITDFAQVGFHIWANICKSEHDRAVLEHMLKFHPDFVDPSQPNGRDATRDDVLRRLGRLVLINIVAERSEQNSPETAKNS